jgi:hypothetical protein
MKASELLTEAQDDIKDEDNWYSGGWSDGYIGGSYDLLQAKKVCAVTSLARVCERHNVSGLEFVETIERSHYCDCPSCDTQYEEKEVVRDIDSVMEDFDHYVLTLLDRAAEHLYGADAISVNDDDRYSHADVMKVYDEAIKRALEEEAVA